MLENNQGQNHLRFLHYLLHDSHRLHQNAQFVLTPPNALPEQTTMFFVVL